MTLPNLLEARNVSKSFGALKANDDVSLHVAHNEIHALLGENGAGKSTLVKMIYGALQPATGSFSWEGQDVQITSPSVARKLGVGMVFQHFSLFEALTVAENIALALDEPFDMAKLSAKIGTVSAAYGLPLKPDALVADLSVGERQRIEIVRCLLQEPKLLIMDEPTAVLTPQEADLLFKVLRRLAREGCSILYISHRLDEVRRLCDNATILRLGKVVARVDPRKETAGSLARLMVGNDIPAVHHVAHEQLGAVRLKLNALTLAADGPFAVKLSGISLNVHAGEIVAIAGVAGNGQSELFDALSGERLVRDASMLSIDGQECGRTNVSARRRLGAAFVPEERIGHAAVPRFNLSENVILSRHAADADIAPNGILGRFHAGQITERVSKVFDVRKGKPDPQARSLSGGNLQKFIVGRELDRDPGILVVNQPTWGVDAGSAATIRQALVDLAERGSAILIISQDLDEIFEIADRIAVISRGILSEAHPAPHLDAEKIGLLMAGAHEDVHVSAA